MTTSTTTVPAGARRLIASLLPPTWPGRLAAVRAAARLDARHDGNGLETLLAAWDRFRAYGELPNEPAALDLVAVFDELLGGVRHQLHPRRRAPELEVAAR